MDPKKNPDMNIEIGGESYEPSPDFREDAGAHKIAADALIGMLPVHIKRQIFAITKARGMNRSSRRATRVLVNRGIREVNATRARDDHRKQERDARDLSLFRRIEKRIARGLDKPLPGMTAERYATIKSTFGRVDSLQINGEQVEQLGGAIVRMRDGKVDVYESK